jgi:hypothetical protein
MNVMNSIVPLLIRKRLHVGLGVLKEKVTHEWKCRNIFICSIYIFMLPYLLTNKEAWVVGSISISIGRSQIFKN